jgi:hypothetical protein
MAHWAVVGLFRINKEYIAKNLCENRKQPQKKCCGSCYLKKQLKKVDNQDERSQSGPGTVKVEKSEWVAILPVSTPLFVSALPLQKIEHTTAYTERAVVQVVHSIFHPPATIC